MSTISQELQVETRAPWDKQNVMLQSQCNYLRSENLTNSFWGVEWQKLRQTEG